MTRPPGSGVARWWLSHISMSFILGQARRQPGAREYYIYIDTPLISRITHMNTVDWRVVGGAIPRAWAKSIEGGFRDALTSGIGEDAWPVQGVRVVIEDGATHVEDSSDRAFYVAAQEACRAMIPEAGPRLLEPLARVEAEAPTEHQGAVLRTLITRRGNILGTESTRGVCRVHAEVPLADLFGYASALRSATAGTGTFSQVFARYGDLGRSAA